MRKIPKKGTVWLLDKLGDLPRNKRDAVLEYIGELETWMDNTYDNIEHFAREFNLIKPEKENGEINETLSEENR